MRPLLIEYTRPWKLLTFLAGVALMIAGALADLAPDWDVPISQAGLLERNESGQLISQIA